MTDLGVSPTPALARRPWGWPVVVAANLVGGVAAIIPATYAVSWLVDALGGTAPYSSDPGFLTAVGQVSTVVLVVGFVGGNLWLQWSVTGRRARWWLVALVCAALPAALAFGQHALLYGPS